MPLVKVEIVEGKTAEYKKQLLHSIQEALVSVLQIDYDNRCQRLYELDADCFMRRAAKTDKYTLIEFTLFPGRSKEIKRKLMMETVRRLSESNAIQASDIMIIINEPPLDNWCFNGEQGSDLNLQYKKE